MKDRSSQLKGVLLTAFGVLVLTPDALLIRLIEANVWTLLFWRGLLQGVALTGFYLARYRREALAHFLSVGVTGVVIAFLYTAGNITFINSIRMTAVANTLLIVSSAPLIAAIFSWVFLREKVPLRTWLAAVACLVGIGVIFSGGWGGVSLGGDLCALAAAVSMAGCFVIIRHSKSVNMVPAVALSGFMLALAALPMTASLGVTPLDAGYLFLLGAVIMPVSFGLITLGPRNLTAPEVSLIMILETVLGPVWVWWGLGESPPRMTLAGGAIVLSAVVIHSLIGLRKERRLLRPDHRAW